MDTNIAHEDYEFVAGCYRVVTPEDRAYRHGLSEGRQTPPLPLRACAFDRLTSIHAAYVKGYQAARWEVENSCILG